MKKQTAVEWLIEQFEKDGYLGLQRIEQAKAMEKEQIEDAYWDGGQDVPTHGRQCEQYYQQTFNK